MNCHEYGNDKGLGLQGCSVVPGTNTATAEVRFCIYLWRAWVSCRCGPQLLPRILTKDWMGSVENWIIIDLLNSHRFVRSCHFQKNVCSASYTVVLQCHSWNSCPNLIALDQSEFSSHNALFETVAWLLHVHWSSIYWHVGPTCFKRLRILNLIGFAVHDITLLSRSAEAEKVAVVCFWRLESLNHFSLSWIWQFKCNLT